MLRITLLSFLLAGLAAGCGAPCENVISAQRTILDAKPNRPDGKPHAQLRLPHNRVNVLLSAALASEEIAAELSLPGPIKLPGMKAKATRIEMINARPGTLGFITDIEVELIGKPLLKMSATVEAKPKTTQTDGRTRLVIGFDGDSLRSVKPDIPDDAIGAMSKLLGPAVKAATGREVPPLLLGAVTRRLLDFATTEGFELIRDQILARVGEVSAIAVDLGRAPIERVVARTSAAGQPALVVDLYASIRINVGLADAPPLPDPISGTGRLRISGETLAELGNWAIAEGLAPQAYDQKLRPDENGAYVPVYQWRSDPRPLVIHAFRIKSPCSKIVVGAKPVVKVEDGTVTVGIEDGSVEEVEGSTLVRLGVALKNLFGDSIEKSESSGASAAFEVGGRPLAARLIDANFAADELDLTIELTVGKTP